jgi:hypothetical protein
MNNKSNGNHGAVIGEYVCSGHIYSANAGGTHFEPLSS